MNPLIVIIIIAGMAGAIYLIVKAVQAYQERERLRKAALAYWGSLNGFSYSDGDPWNLDSRYNGVGEIGRGHDRYAFETLIRSDPIPSTIFQYQYKTWETRTVTRLKGQRSHRNVRRDPLEPLSDRRNRRLLPRLRDQDGRPF